MRICIAHDEIGDDDGSSRYLADVARFFREEGHDVGVAARWTRSEKPPPPAEGPWDVLLATDRAPRIEAKRFVYAPLDLFAPTDERVDLERCDVLLRFTDGAVRALEERYALPLAHKAIAVPYVSRAFEERPEPDFARTGNRLLWVGRLIPEKDVAFLFRAVERLRTPDWELRVCGRGPERVPGGRVRALGFVDDLSREYATAKLFLTASPTEHFSLTLMEAYAHGTPCLGRRPDGETVRNACDVQIEDGRTGYLFSTEEELASRIDDLLADEPRRQAMARAGWQRKREVFSLARFHDALRTAIAG
ncbi:MAG: glycosyltransferase family 4 protein [Planctomycetota bacterium]